MEAVKAISHAISQRIFLVLQKNHLTCLITDKHKVPLLYEEFEWLDEGLLTKYIQQRPYFSEIYSSSRLILVEPKFTLVPGSYHLLSSEFESIFGLNHHLKADEQLVSLEIDYEKQILCSVYEDLYKPLSKTFPGLRTHHELFYILNDHRFNKLGGEVLIVGLLRGALFIASCINNELVYANNFDVKSEEEFKYFTMLVVEQLQLHTEKCKLVCLNSEINPSHVEWFKEYFADVVTPSMDEIALSKLNESEIAQFEKAYVLHSAILCE